MLTGTCSSGGTLVAALKWRRNISSACNAECYLHRRHADTSHRERSQKTAALSVAVFLHLSVRCFDGGAAQVLYSQSCLTGSWGRRSVADSIITPPCPAGGRRKSCHTLPVLQCAAIFYPRVLTARLFTRTAYLGGADVRQVRQVRHQTAAPVRQSYRSGHTALVHNRSGLITRCLESCYTSPVTQRKFCIAGHA